MISALCVAVAVFLAIRPSSLRRCRRIFSVATKKQRTNPPPTLIAMALAVVVGVTFLGLPTGLLVGGVAAPFVGRLVAGLESVTVRRRRLLLLNQLPGAVDLLIAALDAGRPPGSAFAMVGRASADPVGAEFAAIARRLSVSGDDAAVWDTVRADAALAPLGRSFARAGRSGMPVGKILERLADELRRERRASSQERARSIAVSTAAPLGLCFLPAFFLIGIVPTIYGTFMSLHW